MSEVIRYAWGQSSLGEILVAWSDRGLAAFEFVDRREQALVRLNGRFPESLMTEENGTMRDVVEVLGALVDHPDHAIDLPLDLRGSAQQKRVWEILRRIPAGSTTTYGAIAAELGTRDAREVTEAIVENGIAILVPCHRVIKKDGSLSGYRWGFWRKRALLSREVAAVPFEFHRSVA